MYNIILRIIIILYIRAHGNMFTSVCVSECVPSCDLTSRVAGRRQLSNFQRYYILFFFPAAEHKSKLWNYRISVGLPKKGVPETIVCTSVIVSPNNHHNNRPGRRECSVRLLWIKKRNKIIHKKKWVYTAARVCCDAYVGVYLHLVVVVARRSSIGIGR